MADLVLDWGLFGAYGTDLGATQTVDTGGIEVTVGFTAEDENAQAFTFNGDGYVGTGEEFDPNSFLKLFGDGGEGGIDDTSTTTIDFASSDPLFGDEVQNVSFRLNDIDFSGSESDTASGGTLTHLDIVTIRAYDASGNPVSVSITPGSDVTMSGNTLTGNNDWLLTSPEASALVEIDGPVSRVEIEYDNGEVLDQRVTVTDIHFSTVDACEPCDPNDDPVANDDTAATLAGVAVNINVLGNDTDADGDTLSVMSVTQPTNGTVVVNADGTVTYTPDGSYVGPDSFTYVVTDPSGGTDTGTVDVTVNPPVSARDGYVDGTGGDDLIDVTYTGDPDGDLIDNNDQILPGEDVDDDIVRADDGNDTVYAGRGDDEVLGGFGNDELHGETGDDSLIGEEGDDLLDGDEGDDTIRGGDGDDTATGGDGDDVIDTSGTSPAIDVVTLPGVSVDATPDDDHDVVDGGAGNDVIDTGDDRDTVDGGTGNDTINAGIDDDVVRGGDGDDYIIDPQGADNIDGGDGNDTIIAGIDTFSDYVGDDPNLPIGSIVTDPNVTDGMDTVMGGAGDDVISTGDDADLIDGGTGADTINGGIDDDTIRGGSEGDSILGGHGSDSILGETGDDFIDASAETSGYLYPNEPDATDPIPENDRDWVEGGEGNDTILTGDDDDTVDGGVGNDWIDGGIDDDLLRGRAGDDTVTGGEGADTISGGFGEDLIMGGDDSDAYPDLTDDVDPDTENDRDFLDGRQDNDTIFGGDDDDTLMGGLGDDLLDGGIDEDSIEGGSGDDTIIGGQGADTIYGQGGRDVIMGADDGDYVDGGSSPTGMAPDGLPYDYDTLDLRGTAPTGGRLDITYTSGDREDGFVDFFDDTGALVGHMEFRDIENVVPCFTPGTAIATPKGERMVEELKVGDRIITRDNGIQEIRWMGSRNMTGHELARAPHLRPILIQKGSLGENLPEHDILVSPQHRLLLSGDKPQLYFEEREVLAAAKHLTDLPGVDEVGTLGVTYVHFMFDNHEVVLSNGAWTESFQPGANVLDGLGNEQRDEILDLFPELKTREGVDNYAAARRSLKKHEARLLAR